MRGQEIRDRGVSYKLMEQSVYDLPHDGHHPDPEDFFVESTILPVP